MAGLVEYKVDSRWSKKWKRQVYVVERHNSATHNPRLIAVYTDPEVARHLTMELNAHVFDER